MAQFRNVSGRDLFLSLPQWWEGRLVEADAVVEVEDDLVAAHDQDKPRNYFSPSLWEPIVAPAKRADKKTDGE